MAALDDTVRLTFQDSKIILDWQSIEGLATTIRQKMEYQAFPEIERVVALGRGGLVPARLLAKDKAAYYVGISSYDKDNNPGQLLVHQSFPNRDLLNQGSTLFVDDIYDTGATMKWVAEAYPDAKRATFLSKVHFTQTNLHYMGMFVPYKEWIVFPWEK